MIYIGNGIYSDATPNEYLAHYGVLGMKWGRHLFGRAREGYNMVRKNPRKVGRSFVNAHKKAYNTYKSMDKRPYAKKAVDVTGDIVLTGGLTTTRKALDGAFRKTKLGQKTYDAYGKTSKLAKETAKEFGRTHKKAAKAVKDFMPKKGALKRRAKRAENARKAQAKARYDYRSGKITKGQARKKYIGSIGNFYKETYGRR